MISHATLRRAMVEEGAPTLTDDGARQVAAGATTKEELLRVAAAY